MVTFSIHLNRRVFVIRSVGRSTYVPQQRKKTYLLTCVPNAQADLNLRCAHTSVGTCSDVADRMVNTEPYHLTFDIFITLQESSAKLKSTRTLDNAADIRGYLVQVAVSALLDEML